MEYGSDSNVVRYDAVLPPVVDWADPGWDLTCGQDQHIPTFVRAIRKKKPGFLPAGIATRNKATKARWAADGYRYAPYQYKTPNLMYKI